MSLAELPLLLMLAGLVAYAVLAGADFGAGFWYLLARGRRQQPIREHAQRALAPVWEANHVWLIFVLAVCWTAYPLVFASIASSLAVPLFVAAAGIILRGASYALRSETGPTGRDVAGIVFALSSILTPFALGAAVGAIASGRVPVGNARGDLLMTWLNPTSALGGVLGIATGAYLAAVYLAADAARIGHHALVRGFRARALAAGLVAGALAVAGLGVVYLDARPLWEGLTRDGGLAAVVVSALAGVATLVLVARRRFELARATAALAVAAVVAGWVLAQRPYFLPGLTVEEAAAEPAPLVGVLVTALIAAAVLVPSLGLLFALVLRGRFDEQPSERPERVRRRRPLSVALGPVAALGLVVGAGLLLFSEPGWTLAAGLALLLAAAGLGFAMVVEPRGGSNGG